MIQLTQKIFATQSSRNFSISIWQHFFLTQIRETKTPKHKTLSQKLSQSYKLRKEAERKKQKSFSLSLSVCCCFFIIFTSSPEKKKEKKLQSKMKKEKIIISFYFLEFLFFNNIFSFLLHSSLLRFILVNLIDI